MRTIPFGGKQRPAEYLGDGVYAIFDGFGIWLHANSHDEPTDKVYIEPSVFRALVDFEKASKSPEVIAQCR